MVSRRGRQAGVSYIALLLAVAITNGALAAGATVWSQRQRRERETQLLWAGDQIRRAIMAYAQAGADRDTGFPRSLQDLLLDPRTPAPRRFLRQIYEDPMSRDAQWGLIRDAQGRLVGVYSRAPGVPAKKARFAAEYAGFEGATSYAGWRFAAVELPGQMKPAQALPGARAASAASAAEPAASSTGVPARAPAPAPARDSPAPQAPAAPSEEEASVPPQAEPEAEPDATQERP